MSLGWNIESAVNQNLQTLADLESSKRHFVGNWLDIDPSDNMEGIVNVVCSRHELELVTKGLHWPHWRFYVNWSRKSCSQPTS